MNGKLGVNLLSSFGIDGPSTVLTGDATVDVVVAGRTFYSNNAKTKLTGTLSSPNFIPGENYILRDQVTAYVNTNSYSQVKNYQVGYSGTLRVVFGIFAGGTSTDAYGRVYKNGVAVGVERSTSATTVVTFTEDIPVSVGDFIQLYVKKTGTTSVAYSEFYLKIGNIPQVYV